MPYTKEAIPGVQVTQSFNTSLNNLQTDYLDALLLHSPLPTFEQTIDAWHEMETLYKTGKVKLLGISNCYDLDLFKKLFDNSTINQLFFKTDSTRRVTMTKHYDNFA